MRSLADVDSLMPGTEAYAAIDAEIASYNAGRLATLRVGWARVGGVVAAAVLLLTGVFLATSGLGKGAGATILTVGIMLWGVGLWWGLIWAWRPIKELQLGLRHAVIPVLLNGFVDRVTYRQGSEPGLLQNLKHLRLVDFTSAEPDDQVGGVHEGMQFTLLEVQLYGGSGKNRRTVFKGLVLHLILDREFPGMLVVGRRHKGNWLTDIVNAVFPGEVQSVFLADDVLDRAYEVRTDAPAAALETIEVSVKPALQFLRRSWSGADVRLALRRRECFLVLPSDRNFFALPGLKHPLHYEAHVRPMINEMRLLLAIGQLLRKL